MSTHLPCLSLASCEGRKSRPTESLVTSVRPRADACACHEITTEVKHPDVSFRTSLTGPRLLQAQSRYIAAMEAVGLPPVECREAATSHSSSTRLCPSRMKELRIPTAGSNRAGVLTGHSAAISSYCHPVGLSPFKISCSPPQRSDLEEQCNHRLTSRTLTYSAPATKATDPAQCGSEYQRSDHPVVTPCRDSNTTCPVVRERTTSDYRTCVLHSTRIRDGETALSCVNGAPVVPLHTSSYCPPIKRLMLDSGLSSKHDALFSTEHRTEQVCSRALRETVNPNAASVTLLFSAFNEARRASSIDTVTCTETGMPSESTRYPCTSSAETLQNDGRQWAGDTGRLLCGSDSAELACFDSPPTRPDAVHLQGNSSPNSDECTFYGCLGNADSRATLHQLRHSMQDKMTSVEGVATNVASTGECVLRANNLIGSITRATVLCKKPSSMAGRRLTGTQSHPLPWCAPVTMTSDSELQRITQQALRRMYIRVMEACTPDRPFDLLAQLQEEEREHRECEVRRPYEVYSQQLSCLWVAFQGKQALWQCFLDYERCFQQQLDLLRCEKTQRLALLGEYISCQYPVPCRCLLLDMEILEESAVDLSPKVSLLCLFVSAVLSSYAGLAETMLSARWKEMQYMGELADTIVTALRGHAHLVFEEGKEWIVLCHYNDYCQKVAPQSATLPLASTAVRSDPLGTEQQCVCDNDGIMNSSQLPVSTHQLSYDGPALLSRKDSPFCPYQLFLRILQLLPREEATRQQLYCDALVATQRFLAREETLLREHCWAEEEARYCDIVMEQESTQRQLHTLEEQTQLNDLSPHSALQEIAQFHSQEKEEEIRHLRLLAAGSGLHTLYDHERAHRCGVQLLERQIRVELCHIVLKLFPLHEKAWLASRALKRCTDAIGADEVRLRCRIEQEETMCRAPVHREHCWHMEVRFPAYRALRTEEENEWTLLQHIFLVEVHDRWNIQRQWEEEQEVLLGRLVLPHEVASARSVAQATKGSIYSQDVRQTVVLDLLRFVSDYDVLFFLS